MKGRGMGIGEEKVVEILVRGVGGETAEEILGGQVDQVAGDGMAGFYRRSPINPAPPTRHTVEAYEWGRLTSGTADSALWWVFFPCTLVNLAGWLFSIDRLRKPAGGSGDRIWATDPDESAEQRRLRSVTAGRRLVVASGLLVTALYVVWIGLITVGTVALGCGDPEIGKSVAIEFSGDPPTASAVEQQCADRGPLKALLWFAPGPESDGSGDQGEGIGARRPSALWQLAVGVALATLVWALLLAVLQRTQVLEAYEKEPVVRALDGRDAGEDGGRFRRNTRLRDLGFWYHWTEYQQLWRSYLLASAVALGLVGGVAFAALRHSERLEGAQPWVPSIALVSVVLVLGFAYISGSERRPAVGPQGKLIEVPGVRLSLAWGLVHYVAACVTGVLAYYVASKVGSGSVAVNLRGLVALTVILLALIGVAILVVLAINRSKGYAGGFSHGGPFTLCALAAALVSGGFASINFLIGRAMLGADQFTQLATDTPFPEMVLISLIAVAIVWVPGRWWRSRSVATVSGVRTEYAIPSDQALTLRERIWVARVRTGRRLATLPRYGDRLLTYWTWSIALVVLIAIGVEVRAAGQWGLPVLPMPLFWEWTRAGHATAATLMVLFLFPGLAMIRLAFRHRKGRRSVGVVWDVASFWPRRFHPFAAPSYAERAVPELRDRVKAYLDEGKGVVLSAHSQGSVIAFAALSQISGLTATLDGAPIGNLLGYENPFDSGPAEYARAQPYSTRLNRVSLITYGSPLTELYGRLLPSYFGTEGLFNNLRNELAGGGGEHSWRHFYRPTDYIGKRVFAYPGGCLPDDQRCGIDDLPSDASPDRRLLESTRKGDGIPQRMLPHESHSNYGRELALRSHHDAAVAALADLPAVEALP